MGDVPSHAVAAPLVGRDAELNELAGLVGLGSDSSSGSVLLGGDAGVGKTRVLAELRSRAQEAGWTVLVGHCLDFGDSALPYLPFSEMLGTLADLTVPGESLVDRYPAVRRLLPGRRLLSGGASPDGDTVDPSDLLQAVHSVLDDLAGQAPLLVVVEDLHWADTSTRDMVS